MGCLCSESIKLILKYFKKLFIHIYFVLFLFLFNFYNYFFFVFSMFFDNLKLFTRLKFPVKMMQVTILDKVKHVVNKKINVSRSICHFYTVLHKYCAVYIKKIYSQYFLTCLLNIDYILV